MTWFLLSALPVNENSTEEQDQLESVGKLPFIDLRIPVFEVRFCVDFRDC